MPAKGTCSCGAPAVGVVTITGTIFLACTDPNCPDDLFDERYLQEMQVASTLAGALTAYPEE